MSKIKRWFEDHWHELSKKELYEMGFTDEDIELFKECFPKEEQNEKEIS